MRLFEEMMALNNVNSRAVSRHRKQLAIHHWSSFAMPHDERLVHVHKVEPELWQFWSTICSCQVQSRASKGTVYSSSGVTSRLGSTILEESRLAFERVRYLTDSRVALA